ncbi:MAG: hypothetical protein V3R84_02540, partial [Acidimicrobiia bacterium]
PPEPPRRPSLRPRRAWAVAVAALVATLAILGGIVLLLPGDDGEVVDEPTPTTFPAPTTTPTPSTLAGPPPTIAPIPASGFVTIPIDTEGIVGSSPAIAVAPSGNPVMAYQGLRDINVAVCADPACASPSSVVTIAEAGGTVNRELGPALAVQPDGTPVVAFGFTTSDDGDGEPPSDLRLVVCDDPTCSAWTTTVIVEGELVQAPAVTVTDDGRPVVAFHQRDSELHLAVCDDAACSGFAVTSVDQGEWVNSVVAAPGEPPTFLYQMDNETLLATCDATCGEVTVTPLEGIDSWRAAVARGPRGLVILTVDEHEVVDEADGEPPVDITLISCLDAACQETTSAVIATAVNGFELQGVAVDAVGNPVIAYSQWEGLSVAHCNDPECLTPATIGMAGLSGEVALAMGTDGNPLLAYHTGSDLVLIRCVDPACVEAPPPAPPPPALAFTDTAWTINVAAEVVFDNYGPQVLFDAEGLPIILHNAPTGTVGPEGENEWGLARADCEDSSCSQVTNIDPAELNTWFGANWAIDGQGRVVSTFWSYDTDRMLGFARCDDVACSSATTTELFVADAWANPDIAIASDGLAVMAFQNYTFNPGPIQVAFCADAECSSVDVVDLDFDCVDADCNRFWVHNSTALALTPDDRPVVVYTSSSGLLRLVVCEDARCSSFEASTLDDTGGASEAAEVTIGPDGNPVVGYYADGTAKLAFCLDPHCDEVAVAELGESIRDAWALPRMAVLGDGRIAVAYSAPTDSPRLAVCSYPCTDPAVSVLVGVTGSYSLGVGPDGLPLIAFIDGADWSDEPPYEIPGRLVVAKCADLSCLGG